LNLIELKQRENNVFTKLETTHRSPAQAGVTENGAK